MAAFGRSAVLTAQMLPLTRGLLTALAQQLFFLLARGRSAVLTALVQQLFFWFARGQSAVLTDQMRPHVQFDFLAGPGRNV